MAGTCAPAGEFPTPDGRARFSAVTPPLPEVPEGSFLVATRRGKQFNSMVFGNTDPMTGAGRDAVFIDEADATAIGVGPGDRVRLRSSVGTYEGRVHLARLPARCLQVHYPEGNVLIASGADHREPRSKVPDYNAVVTVEPLTAE